MGKHGEYTVESINEPSPRAVIEAWLILLRHYPLEDSQPASEIASRTGRAPTAFKQHVEDEQATEEGRQR